MLLECMQGRFFEKHSNLRDLAWKNRTKFACNMEIFYEISMEHVIFLHNFHAEY